MRLNEIFENNELEKELATMGTITAGGMAAKRGVQAARAAAGLSPLKVIPGGGTAISAYDAAQRWKEGDKLGAGIAGLAAGAYAIPGLGVIPGTILDLTNVARDYKQGKLDPAIDWAKEKLTPSSKPQEAVSQNIRELINKLENLTNNKS